MAKKFTELNRELTIDDIDIYKRTITYARIKCNLIYPEFDKEAYFTRSCEEGKKFLWKVYNGPNHMKIGLYKFNDITNKKTIEHLEKVYNRIIHPDKYSLDPYGEEDWED